MRNTIIAITCPFCGADHEVEVNFEEYVNWIGGELIQNAMPSLTPTEREQLISHICPKCQEGIFGAEDDPEPPDDCDYEVGFDPYSGCFTDDC
jgi:hypothetical protein